MTGRLEPGPGLQRDVRDLVLGHLGRLGHVRELRPLHDQGPAAADANELQRLPRKFGRNERPADVHGVRRRMLARHELVKSRERESVVVRAREVS